MYAAFSKRKVAEELTQRKLLLVASLWANTNMDDPKANRQDAITKLEESFDEAIRSLYDASIKRDEDVDLNEDPFFAAMKIPTLTYDTGDDPEDMSAGGGS